MPPASADGAWLAPRSTDLVLDSAHEAFVAIDATGTIIRWNRAAQETFGWRMDEVLGMPLAEKVVPERLRGLHARGIARLAAGGGSRLLGQRLELTALHRDGHEFPVEITISSLQIDGEIAYPAFVHDISDRRRTEQLLGVQHDVASILAASPPLEDAVGRVLGAMCARLGWDAGAVWLLGTGDDALRCMADHATDDRTGRFLEATRHARFPRGVGLPGRVWRSCAPAWIPDVAQDSSFPRRRHAMDAGLRSAVGRPIMNGEQCVGVLELLRRSELPSGDAQLVEVMTLVTSQLGQYVARKRAEQDLERSNRDLESLASVAAHDLSAPLQIISGYAEVLREHFGDGLDEDAEEFLAAMLRGTTRMRAIIDGLLSFARVSQVELERGPVDCWALVKELLETLRPAIERTQAEVTVDQLPTVQGDAVRLGQVLQNLLGNALKFQDGAAPRVSVSAARLPAAWSFAVADNGIGVDPADVERIFQPFTRGRTARRYEGSGIGLATCRRVVERHGGALWVESTLGEGSTFRFTLPD